MKQPKLGPLFLAVIIFLLILTTFMHFIDGYLKKTAYVDGLASKLDPRKFQGLFIEKKALASNDCLFIFDSSDLLNTNNPYHPSNIFREKPTEFIPYLIGRGGTTNIIHILNLVALNNSIKNKKVVFITSPTWYLPSTPGHEDYNFTMNFSAIQAYQFVFNKDINSNLKAKIAKRLLNFNRIYWDPVLTSLLIGITNHSLGRTINYIANPLGHVMLSFLEQLDYFDSYQLIRKYNKQSYQPVRKASLDWQKLMVNAERDGQKACQTNSFSIDDKNFRENIKTKLKGYRNSCKKDTCSNLGQYQELQLILSVFKELKIKPLIVVQPMNGFWSDYTGLPKKVRKECYAKVKRIIKESGFGYVDFSDHEYDRYFIHDTKHIGWKGWVYIDQSMDQFYNHSVE